MEDKIKQEKVKHPRPLEYYTSIEVKYLIENKEELVLADDGIEKAIIKLKDVPDFIVDISRRFGARDFQFFSMENYNYYQPDIITIGECLEKIKPDMKEKIMGRIVALQKKECKPNKVKIISQQVYKKMKDKVEKDSKNKRKERGAR